MGRPKASDWGRKAKGLRLGRGGRRPPIGVGRPKAFDWSGEAEGLRLGLEGRRPLIGAGRSKASYLGSEAEGLRFTIMLKIHRVQRPPRLFFFAEGTEGRDGRVKTGDKKYL